MAPAKKAAAKKTPAKATKKAPAKKAAAKKAPKVPASYDPMTDKKPYMNPVMIEFFRQRLIDWREDLMKESSETQENLKETELQKPDLADRAAAETDHALELRTRDRERKLINKITSTINKITDGEYGYCTETGDEIGVSRMLARPVASMTLEAQEMHERNEKVHRED